MEFPVRPITGFVVMACMLNALLLSARVEGAGPTTPSADTNTLLSQYTPQELRWARARGMIMGNGLPIFPPGTVKFNSQGAAYNPARVGAPSRDPSNLSLPGGVDPLPFPNDLSSPVLWPGESEGMPPAPGYPYRTASGAIVVPSGTTPGGTTTGLTSPPARHGSRR